MENDYLKTENNLVVLGKYDHFRLLKFLAPQSRLHYETNLSSEELTELLKFTSKEYNLTSKEQTEFFKTLIQDFRALDYHFSLRDLFSVDELATLLAQRFYKDFQVAHYFSRYFLKKYADGASFVVALPRCVLERFSAGKLKINYKFSNLFWGLHFGKYFAKGLIENAKETVKIFRDYFFLRKKENATNKSLPSVFWLGLAPTDFGKTDEGISIFKYLKAKRLPFLKNNEVNFVSDPYSDQEVYEVEGIRAGRNHMCLPGRAPVSFAVTLRMLKMQAKIFLSFLKSTLRGSWWDIVLAEEYAKLPRAYFWFDSVKPKILAKPHSANIDFLWMLLRKNFGTQLWTIFYSTFGRDIEFVGEEVNASAPHHSVYVSDFFAVWNQEQKRWLESLGYPEQKIVSCGTIVFANFPEHFTLLKKDHSKVVISLFDVAPFDNEMLIHKGRQIFYFLYDNVTRFILKPKYSKNVDERYPEFLKKLFDARPGLVIKEVLSSPVETVLRSDIAISMPFTSPVYIAQDFGKPSCFYDVTSTVAAQFYSKEHPPLIRGKADLKRWLLEIKGADPLAHQKFIKK
jgi:hypothetical protein